MMDNFEIVYAIRQHITGVEYKLKQLKYENVQNNRERNRQTVAQINRLEAALINLRSMHHDGIYTVYSQLIKRPQTGLRMNHHAEIEMKTTELDIGDNEIVLKMTPNRFQLDDRKSALKDIIYPSDGTDRHLINTIARYRTLINKSKDFILEPIESDPSSIEMILIGLENFVRQYGGEISFSNSDLSFANGTEYAACGIVNLGNIHLLATDFIPTAKFSIRLNIDYDRDLTQSKAQLKTFLFRFVKELADLLECQQSFVRIFSIEKLDQRRNLIRIHFGLTTTERNQTIDLAKHFQNLLRRSDFRNRAILRYIESSSYGFELIPSVSYLQISPFDFQPEFNYNYTNKDQSIDKQYGGYPCHIPIGWFRHALSLANKYPNDDSWFNHSNVQLQWPIAYHGTQSACPTTTTRQQKMNRVSNFYLSTHPNGGADEYTESFHVSTNDMQFHFQLLFQCRVKPESFTVREGIMNTGHAWKVNQPDAIRPYSLLIRKSIV